MRVIYTCRAAGGTARIVEGRQGWTVYLGAIRVPQKYFTPVQASTHLASGYMRWPPGVDGAQWVLPAGIEGWARETSNTPIPPRDEDAENWPD